MYKPLNIFSIAGSSYICASDSGLATNTFAAVSFPHGHISAYALCMCMCNIQLLYY